jgi:hypothetical protein
MRRLHARGAACRGVAVDAARQPLIPPTSPGIVRAALEGAMRRAAGAALVSLLLLGGCGGGRGPCPVPVHYDDATLKRIEKAREALPKDSVLLRVLEDYENERDDLRTYCR